MAAYCVNLRVCIDEKHCDGQDKVMKRIKSEFLNGLFYGIKLENLKKIKREIGTKMNKKLLDLTEDEFEKQLDEFKSVCSDILLTFNSIIFPNNTVWTARSIDQMWISHGHGSTQYDDH